jgi:MFS family permease
MDYSWFDTFAALRHRNFRLFYTGQAISLMGSWMQSVALNWLVLILTDSSFFLGLVGALQTLPVLIFSFMGGVVADRAHKRRLLFLTQSSMMLLAFILGLLVSGELVTRWLLLVLVFLSGTAMAFDIPVRQAFIVDLVGKPDLANAIALNSTLFNGTRVIGPALAGVLIAQVGMANCFYLNAASFLAVLLALAWMKLPPLVPAPYLPFGRALREMGDYLRDHRDLKAIFILLTTVSILGHSYYVLLPKLVKDVFGGGSQEFGLLMAVSGLGAFLGGLTLARRLRSRPPMPSFLGGLGIFLVGLLALSLVRHYYLALPAIGLVGFGMVTQLSTGNSLLQLNVPDHMRGRIMSLFGLIVMGSVPAGSLLYGLVAHYLGPSFTITGGSLLSAAAAGIVLWRYPHLRHLDFQDPQRSGAPLAPRAVEPP